MRIRSDKKKYTLRWWHRYLILNEYRCVEDNSVTRYKKINSISKHIEYYYTFIENAKMFWIEYKMDPSYYSDINSFIFNMNDFHLSKKLNKLMFNYIDGYFEYREHRPLFKEEPKHNGVKTITYDKDTPIEDILIKMCSYI